MSGIPAARVDPAVGAAHGRYQGLSEGWSLRQVELWWRAMDWGRSPDHHLHKAATGLAGQHSDKGEKTR